MKLTGDALQRINTPNMRRELSDVLRCTEQTIIRYIGKNEENGPLTTLAALETINEYTGIAIQKMILRQPSMKQKFNKKDY